ncbi:MAG: AAA family ATPase [Saprospiraceae bacterium]|jgi:predicted kinase
MYIRKLILVVGLPGTGKTTFARALSTAIGARHLNSDIIRHDAGERGHYDMASKAAIYDEMLNRTESFLKNRQPVVIDATFYKNIFRKPYQLLGEKYDVDVKWIEIKADEEIIKERVNKKREYSEADFEVYKKIKEDYEPLEMPHLILWSGLLTVEEMVFRAKEYLK